MTVPTTLLYYVQRSITAPDYAREKGEYILPQTAIPYALASHVVPIYADCTVLSVIRDNYFNVYRILGRCGHFVTVRRIATDDGMIRPRAHKGEETYAWLHNALNGMVPLLPGLEIEHYQAYIGGELAYHAPTRKGKLVKVCEGLQLDMLGNLIIEYPDGRRQAISWRQLCTENLR